MEGLDYRELVKKLLKEHLSYQSSDDSVETLPSTL